MGEICGAEHPDGSTTCVKRGDHVRHLDDLRRLWPNEEEQRRRAHWPTGDRKAPGKRGPSTGDKKALEDMASSSTGLPPRGGPPAFPMLPYNGDTSSGWSGSDTSEARARYEDSSGITSQRQQLLYRLLFEAGERGLTSAEARDLIGEHHGKASGPLSVMHRQKRVIARLKEVRDGYEVYVHPDFINGRELARIRSSTHAGSA